MPFKQRPTASTIIPAIAGVLVCIAVAGVLAGCRPASEAVPEMDALPYYAEASFTPQWYPAPDAVPEDFHAIPAFSLTNQHGQTVTERDLDGKLTIANFFFASCPGICPMTMANMARVQRAFEGDDSVVLLSHSVTPERDSVAVLRAFADRMHALSSTWHLVTGDRDTMYDLGKSVYFADEDLGEAPENQADAAFTHTESFFLLDGERRIRGVYNGMNTAAVTQLIADVRTLQREQT